MPRHVVGWAFVAAQAALLLALVLAPGGDAWPTPPWIQALGSVALVLGLVVMVVAGLRLGSGLTATPVPTETARLATGGLYRFVRHPIYSGVLLAVAGITLRSGGAVRLVLALVIVAFFHVKSRWEEARLRERYPDYAAYAERTPRFVPRVPTTRR